MILIVRKNNILLFHSRVLSCTNADQWVSVIVVIDVYMAKNEKCPQFIKRIFSVLYQNKCVTARNAVKQSTHDAIFSTAGILSINVAIF